MTNLEKLKTATPGQIRDMFCEDCDKCPKFIFERCDAGKNGFAAWLNEEAETQKEETKTPKDAREHVPEGWIKLRTTQGDICIDASKIVGLGHTDPDASVVMTGAVTKVYTRGAEDEPWFVYDSIEEIIEKIKKASQEK